MPTLTEAINADRSRLVPVEQATEAGPKTAPPDARLPELLQDTNQRCPVPASYASADAIRQLGVGGDVPRFRVITPAPPNVVGSTGTATINVNSASSSSGGSVTPTPSLPESETASLTTPVLLSGQIYTAQVTMAPSAIMLSIGANVPCRVELYGSAAGQAADLSRNVLTAPNNATYALCSDVVLQGTSPWTWEYLDTLFSNMDDPQGDVAYVTITNISAAASAISLTWVFVPEQSIA